jgi:hypothetical protein
MYQICILKEDMAMHAPARSRSNRPQWLDLHPAVYRLLVGSAVWVFLAIWVSFSHSAYTALQLGVVAVFLAVFIGVPVTLARLAKRPRPAGTASFAEWRAGDLETHTGPVAAGEAAVMVMIAPAACAAGLTIISALAYLTATGAI